VNLLLKRFEKEIGIKDISSEDNKDKLRNFVKNNDELIKDLYAK
jgi:hypothetical protein